jgi:hypothetical protein
LALLQRHGLVTGTSLAIDATTLEAATAKLGLLMRSLTGIGTPKSLQGRFAALLRALGHHLHALLALLNDLIAVTPRSQRWLAASSASLGAA